MTKRRNVQIERERKEIVAGGPGEVRLGREGWTWWEESGGRASHRVFMWRVLRMRPRLE